MLLISVAAKTYQKCGYAHQIHQQIAILFRILVFVLQYQRDCFIFRAQIGLWSYRTPRGIRDRWSLRYEQKSCTFKPGENCKSLQRKQTNFVYNLSSFTFYDPGDTNLCSCSHLMLWKLLSFYLLVTLHYIIVNLYNALPFSIRDHKLIIICRIHPSNTQCVWLQVEYKI